jgi:hypothetical protein
MPPQRKRIHLILACRPCHQSPLSCQQQQRWGRCEARHSLPGSVVGPACRTVMSLAGPAGFEHATVTKGICVASTVSTAVSWYLDGRISSIPALRAPWRILQQRLAFPSATSGLFCIGLLYNFRLLERRYGSEKFGSFAALVGAASESGRLLQTFGIPWPSGPLSLATACLCPFLMDLAPMASIHIGGDVHLNEKHLLLFTGVQVPCVN